MYIGLGLGSSGRRLSHLPRTAREGMEHDQEHLHSTHTTSSLSQVRPIDCTHHLGKSACDCICFDQAEGTGLVQWSVSPGRPTHPVGSLRQNWWNRQVLHDSNL